MAAGDADGGHRRVAAVHRLGGRRRADGAGARRLYLFRAPEMDLGHSSGIRGGHHRPYRPQRGEIAMGGVVQQVEFLLLIAGVVAMIARKLRLPYSVGLVMAGIGLTFVQPFDLPFTKDLIFTVLLPPLIFEAAL